MKLIGAVRTSEIPCILDCGFKQSILSYICAILAFLQFSSINTMNTLDNWLGKLSKNKSPHGKKKIPAEKTSVCVKKSAPSPKTDESDSMGRYVIVAGQKRFFNDTRSSSDDLLTLSTHAALLPLNGFFFRFQIDPLRAEILIFWGRW